MNMHNTRPRIPAGINPAAWMYWGTPDQCEELAAGIYQVSTPEHGGWLIDAAHNAKVPPELRNECGAYEEDCNWAIPAVLFKAELKPDRLRDAGSRMTLTAWHPDHAKLILQPQTEADAIAAAQVLNQHSERVAEAYNWKTPTRYKAARFGDSWETHTFTVA